MQSSTFYEALKNGKELDLPDRREKLHFIGLVLMRVFIDQHRNKDCFLSSTHRSIKNTHAQLCHYLGVESRPAVSRAQLPILLKKINTNFIAKLLFNFVGIVLGEEERQMFAASNGKELRRNIEVCQKSLTVDLLRFDKNNSCFQMS